MLQLGHDRPSLGSAPRFGLSGTHTIGVTVTVAVAVAVACGLLSTRNFSQDVVRSYTKKLSRATIKGGGDVGDLRTRKRATVIAVGGVGLG